MRHRPSRATQQCDDRFAHANESTSVGADRCSATSLVATSRAIPLAFRSSPAIVVRCSRCTRCSSKQYVTRRQYSSTFWPQSNLARVCQSTHGCFIDDRVQRACIDPVKPIHSWAQHSTRTVPSERKQRGSAGFTRAILVRHRYESSSETNG